MFYVCTQSVDTSFCFYLTEEITLFASGNLRRKYTLPFTMKLVQIVDLWSSSLRVLTVKLLQCHEMLHTVW
jgi:hypothetical protein